MASAEEPARPGGEAGSTAPAAIAAGPEAFRCLVCAAVACAAVLTKAAMHLARCLQCGLVQQHPLPAATVYDERYVRNGHGYGADMLRARPLFLRRDEAVLRGLLARGASGPLLDVGAGAGILMEAARNVGLQPVGVELAQGSVAYIREQLGLPVHAVPIERAPFADASFGVVAFSHSLEHLLDPVGALQAARRLLRPGGLVHIAVPHWAAAKRRAAGAAIAWIYDEHIAYFTRRTLRMVLIRAGFDVVACHTLPMACDADHRFAIALFERSRLDRPVRRFLRLGDRRLDTLLGDHVQVACPPWRLRAVDRLARVLLRAWPERLFGWLGLGEELRVTARRR
jgi:SAM-dependent methyltransferase